jgi:ribosomal protein L11 methyltransferase
MVLLSPITTKVTVLEMKTKIDSSHMSVRLDKMETLSYRTLMFVIVATGPRALIEGASNLLENVGGAGAVSWWELERRQFKLEAIYPDEGDAQIGLGALAISTPDLDAQLTPLQEADWIKMSLDGLPPVRAGRFVVLGSHDAGKAKNGKTEIIIDAGEAFGTGHHGTTSGCLRALDRLIQRRAKLNRVLDVGTGSAVLAVAAAKTGSQVVIGTEIDPRANEVANENADVNHVAYRVRSYVANGVRRALIRSQGPFDLVFANILMKPLVRLSADLASIVKPGGRIVLSGLLTHQEPAIRRAYQQRGLVLEYRYRKENWSTLTYRRPM